MAVWENGVHSTLRNPARPLEGLFKQGTEWMVGTEWSFTQNWPRLYEQFLGPCRCGRRISDSASAQESLLSQACWERCVLKERLVMQSQLTLMNNVTGNCALKGEWERDSTCPRWLGRWPGAAQKTLRSVAGPPSSVLARQGASHWQSAEWPEHKVWSVIF